MKSVSVRAVAMWHHADLAWTLSLAMNHAVPGMVNLKMCQSSFRARSGARPVVASIAAVQKRNARTFRTDTRTVHRPGCAAHR